MIEIFSQKQNCSAWYQSHSFSCNWSQFYTWILPSSHEMFLEKSVWPREMGGGDIPPPPHSRLNIGLILSCVFTFLITTVFNALAGSGAGVGSVFYSTVGNISDKYQLYITPAGTI